ncbi:MAG: hypothetical protein LBK29_03565 [Oscillospiraceae bacterium]|jgi:hypothetical protein|nr:hypothetical protein [Oscillospiraceae bacterium]
MSEKLKNIEKFYDQVAKDENLRKKILEVSGGNVQTSEIDNEVKKELLGNIAPLVKNVTGEDATADDFLNFEKQITNEQLDKIGGGSLAFCVGSGIAHSIGTRVVGQSKERYGDDSHALVERGAGIGLCISLGAGLFYASGNERNFKGHEIKAKSWCVIVGF